MWHLLLILLACLLFASGDIGFFIGVLLIVVFLCAVTDSWWILLTVISVIVAIAIIIHIYDKRHKRIHDDTRESKKHSKPLNFPKINDKNIDTLVKLAGRMPCDGKHSISQSNVADIVTSEQWYFCIGWLNENANEYVVIESNNIRAKGAMEKTILINLLYDEKEKRQSLK